MIRDYWYVGLSDPRVNYFTRCYFQVSVVGFHCGSYIWSPLRSQPDRALLQPSYSKLYRPGGDQVKINIYIKLFNLLQT